MSTEPVIIEKQRIEQLPMSDNDIAFKEFIELLEFELRLIFLPIARAGCGETPVRPQRWNTDGRTLE